MTKTIQSQCKFVLQKHKVYFYSKRSLDSFNTLFRKNANSTHLNFIFAVQQFYEFQHIDRCIIILVYVFLSFSLEKKDRLIHNEIHPLLRVNYIECTIFLGRLIPQSG